MVRFGMRHDWRRRFFTIWAGQQASLIGSSVAGFALIWWLTTSSGSATVLATASLVSILPGVLLSPFAGVLVDRWNRRRVMVAADSLVAALSLALAVMFWQGQVVVWHVYLVMGARALANSFHWPAMQASTSLLVPEEHLTRISGLNQTMSGVAGIVSPILGALLLQVLPIYGIMGVDVATALLAVVPLLFIAVPQPAAGPRAAGAPSAAAMLAGFGRDLADGLRFIAGWPGMLMTLALALTINMLAIPAFALVSILVTEHLGGGPAEYGLMQAVYGGGLVAGGLLLGAWGGFRRRMVTTMAGVAGMGIGMAAIGWASPRLFTLAAAGMACVGLMMPIANGPLFAILQTRVPAELQGRVFTVFMSLASAAGPLGLVLAGPVAESWGAPIWFRLAGPAFMLAALVGSRLPAVMGLDDEPAAPVETGIAGTGAHSAAAAAAGEE